MKTLKKGTEFKKVKDSSIEDQSKIDSFIKDGWNYCPKKEYKDFYKAEKSATEAKAEAKKEAKEKKETKKKK